MGARQVCQTFSSDAVPEMVAALAAVPRVKYGAAIRPRTTRPSRFRIPAHARSD